MRRFEFERINEYLSSNEQLTPLGQLILYVSILEQAELRDIDINELETDKHYKTIKNDIRMGAKFNCIRTLLKIEYYKDKNIDIRKIIFPISNFLYRTIEEHHDLDDFTFNMIYCNINELYEKEPYKNANDIICDGISLFHTTNLDKFLNVWLREGDDNTTLREDYFDILFKYLETTTCDYFKVINGDCNAIQIYKKELNNDFEEYNRYKDINFIEEKDFINHIEVLKKSYKQKQVNEEKYKIEYFNQDEHDIKKLNDLKKINDKQYDKYIDNMDRGNYNVISNKSKFYCLYDMSLEDLINIFVKKISAESN